MIEFYSKNFKKNYKTKINQLSFDIKRLLELEKIKVEEKNQIILDINFKKNLDLKTWIGINNLYNTIVKNKDKISNTLNKFINKTNINTNYKFKFIDTFAGCGGLSLGLSNKGFKPVLINGFEPKFLESYYFNHNIHLDNYNWDIKNIAMKYNKNKFRGIDLIVGDPCQGFSMANRLDY